MVDFNKIPFVKAKYFTDLAKEKTDRDPAVIVIHSMEAPEKGETAENVARYFANIDRKASAHYCIDNNSIVQCVQCRDVAYGAAGFNRRGIHLEFAGTARQSYGQWTDEYSLAMLDLGAQLCAKVLMPKFNIIPAWCTPEQLKAIKAGKNFSGFTTHKMITDTFKEGTHWDPGPGFPANHFMERIKFYLTNK